jgi:hypothetical protein
VFYECLIYDDLKLFSPLHFGSFIVLVLAAMNVLLVLLESRLICITTSHPLQNFVASSDSKLQILMVNCKGQLVYIHIELENSVVGTETSYRLDCHGFESRQGQGSFSSSMASILVLGPEQPPIQ